MQIKSIKTPLDKENGVEGRGRLDLKTRKFQMQNGAKCEKTVSVCDHTGKVVVNGTVGPGDIVCTTMHLGTVYNGVGGDKFGISWEIEDVQVVCQTQHMKQKSCVEVFKTNLGDNCSAYDYTFSGNTEFGAA